MTDTARIRVQCDPFGLYEDTEIILELCDEIDRLRAKIQAATSGLVDCQGPYPNHSAPYCDYCNPWLALEGLLDD